MSKVKANTQLFRDPKKQRNITQIQLLQPLPAVVSGNKHLLEQDDPQERTALLQRCMGQQCPECLQPFTQFSLLDNSGRHVLIDLEAQPCRADQAQPRLYTCPCCTYYYTRTRMGLSGQGDRIKLYAPQSQAEAGTFVHEMTGYANKEKLRRRIVVVLP
jgi:hypothetical protein